MAAVDHSQGYENSSPPTLQSRRIDFATPYAVVIISGVVGIFFFPDRRLIIPTALMAGYLAYGLAIAQKKGMNLEFSDSFYYLGFIYTMASLLASLDPFGQVTPTPVKVLGHFGVGLFTTLLGVMGRTTLQMFYQTQDETIGETNQKIKAASIEYLTNLESLNLRSKEVLQRMIVGLDEELKGKLEAIQQSLQAFSESIQMKTQQISGIDHSGLENAVTSASQLVQTSSRQFSQRLTDLATAQQNAMQLTQSLTDIIHGLEVKVGLDLETLSRKLPDVSSRIDGLASRIGTIQISLAGPQDAINVFTPQLKAQLSTTLHSLEREGEEISKVFKEIIEAVTVEVGPGKMQ